MLRNIFTLVVCVLATILTTSAQTPPNNEIWYTTTDGRKLDDSDPMPDFLVSHTFRNGKGVFKFSRDVIRIGDPGPVGIEDDAEREEWWKWLDYHMALAFGGHTRLKSVTIPKTVTRILDYAFSDCVNLRSITIPKNVTEIGREAFRGCTGLTSITIPNSVTEIGYEAFKDCTNLRSITIPNSVTEIYSNVFDGCTGLKSFKGKYASSDGRCLIEDGALIAFAPAGLTSYTIPNGVTEIWSCAFSCCTNLNSITIPDSVKSIGGFSGCTGLTSITIPDSVTEIRGHAFRDCTSLTSVTIPDSVTWIGGYAFEGCTNLKSITIPNSVTEIGYYAFEGCNIEQITISAVTGNIFRGCDGLDPSKVVEYTGKYASEDGRCLIKDGVFIDIIHTGLTSYVIPENITTIGKGVFKGCSTLKEITIPNSITVIGEGAFEDCNIERITINAVTGNIFQVCNGLDPSKVVAYTGKYASEDGRCLIKDGVLIDYIHNGAERYQIPNGVTIISYEVFKGCSSLKSITIPEDVTCIESSTFKGCSSLKSITIPEGVTCIESSTFKGCTNLTDIKIPDSVTEIGWHAFSGCTSLTSINIPNSVTKIWNGTFSGCIGLTSITIPDSVTKIGGYTFAGCTSLTSITIPDSVTEIGGYAFSDCTSLTSINIPNSVTEIREHAFDGCTSLTSITIPNSRIEIEDDAFEGCNIEQITISAVTGNIFRGCDGLDPSKVVAYTGKYASEDGRCLIKDGVLIDFILGNLTSYAIPEGVKVINPEVFSNCYILTDITIPATVTQIGDNLFAGGSPELSITCLSTTPPQVETLGISEEATIYVPKKSVSAYKKAEGWAKHKKQIKRIKVEK